MIKKILKSTVILGLLLSVGFADQLDDFEQNSYNKQVRLTAAQKQDIINELEGTHPIKWFFWMTKSGRVFIADTRKGENADTTTLWEHSLSNFTWTPISGGSQEKIFNSISISSDGRNITLETGSDTGSSSSQGIAVGEPNGSSSSSSTAVKTTKIAGKVGENSSNKITTAIAKSANLSKGLTVFGINFLATSEVPNAKLLHAANIMAELIDSNEDGIADNQAVLNKLIEQSAFETMYNLQEGNKVEIDNGNLMEITKAGTTLGAYETRDNYADGVNHDASIEEIFHLITQFGYSKVYPDIFEEKNGATSKMALLMDKARGGRVVTMPAGGWVYPSTAWWFYDDQTADYATMQTEYMYWAMTSNVGMHDSDAGKTKTSTEWKPYTKALLKQMDPEMYALINDPKYAFPTKLPNADYTFYKFTEADIQVF